MRPILLQPAVKTRRKQDKYKNMFIAAAVRARFEKHACVRACICVFCCDNQQRFIEISHGENEST